MGEKNKSGKERQIKKQTPNYKEQTGGSQREVDGGMGETGIGDEGVHPLRWVLGTVWKCCITILCTQN